MVVPAGEGALRPGPVPQKPTVSAKFAGSATCAMIALTFSAERTEDFSTAGAIVGHEQQAIKNSWYNCAHLCNSEANQETSFKIFWACKDG